MNYDCDVPSEVRAEVAAERRRRSRMRHFCRDCLGFNGPDSPCWDGEVEQVNEENEEVEA